MFDFNRVLPKQTKSVKGVNGWDAWPHYRSLHVDRSIVASSFMKKVQFFTQKGSWKMSGFVVCSRNGQHSSMTLHTKVVVSSRIFAI